MIGHASVQTLLLVGAGLLVNAILEKMVGDAEGPAPGRSVHEGLRRSPDRGPHLGSLSWEEEPGGRFPAEFQPSITEPTVSGSPLVEEKATEIISVDSEMQMASGPKQATPQAEAADRAATPGAKTADNAGHNPQAPSMALSGLETSEKEARLSSAEEARLREMAGVKDDQQDTFSTKTPFLNPPGLPTQTQASETVESQPFLIGTLSPDGLEPKLTEVPGDVRTLTPIALEAHLHLTPTTYLGRATTEVGPPQPSSLGDQREPAPFKAVETEQGVFDIASISGESHQDGGKIMTHMQYIAECRRTGIIISSLQIQIQSWFYFYPGNWCY